MTVIHQLTGLAERYRDLVMIARTHGQQALPITLGAKIAVWLDEMVRNGDRLRACQATTLVSHLFGGVGTMAAFGEQGLELLNRFSARLKLSVPALLLADRPGPAGRTALDPGHPHRDAGQDQRDLPAGPG